MHKRQFRFLTFPDISNLWDYRQKSPNSCHAYRAVVEYPPMNTNTNVRVEKNPNENTTSLIRRFTKRVQGAGILRRVRGMRYRDREPSTFLVKKRKLTSLKKRAEREELIKLGKISDTPVRRRRF